MKISNFNIDETSSTFIIAEIGINHNGQIDIAKSLIEECAKAGVDAVKFQKRSAEDVVLKKKVNPSPVGYLSKDINDIEKDQPEYGNWSYPDIRVELTNENFIELKKFSEDKGLIFFASPWDLPSLKFLVDINVPVIKIPSVEITNYQFLDQISETNLPLILSTGTATIEDVDNAVKLISKKNKDLALLQCTSSYPSKFEEIDLKVINTFKKRYELIVGFSGHEPGISAPIAAVAIGAKIIEKHVTLNKNMNGTDHLASIDMDELKQMVKSIREVEKSLGSPEKKKYESENVLVSILGKSLVTKTDIKKGSILTESMIISKGPPHGDFKASDINNILGKKLKVDKFSDEYLKIDDIE